jgi:hypothetical protein
MGPNGRIANLAVQVNNKPESSTRVPFDGKFPTHLNLASCQRFAQQVPLVIHIRILYFEFVDCIVSQSSFEKPAMCFCLLCSVQYGFIWYLCFTFDIWHFCQSMQSIIQLCARSSARCLDYSIYKTYNCWLSVDVGKQDSAGSMLLLICSPTAANMS